MPNVEPSFVLYALLLEPGGCLRAHITLFELVEPEGKKNRGREARGGGGGVSLVRVRDPPPLPCPLGPLSYQGSMAFGHTYGGGEGARKFCPLC